MAGKISMQSTIDVGTIFSVQLPFLMTSLNPETDLMIHVDKKIVLILSSRKTCLQEITSLFDGAQIATESILASEPECAETINSKTLKTY